MARQALIQGQPASRRHPITGLQSSPFSSTGTARSWRGAPPAALPSSSRVRCGLGMSQRAQQQQPSCSGAVSTVAAACRPRSSDQQHSGSHTCRKRQQTMLGRLASSTAAAAAAAALVVLPLTAVQPAVAANPADVGKCLLSNCPRQLAECVADPNCASALVCLNTCNGRPDETECQIKCSDRFEESTVKTFNECAVTDNGCIPKRVDSQQEWPEPPESALDEDFDLNKFTGRWYITAGLNPLFDTFPCQEHFFGVPEPGKLVGRINWRIPKGDKGDFFERTAIQIFKQQPGRGPAFLLNNDNAYLSYQDKWYILASKPDEFVLIYYKGDNDAWTGYGGATLYTRDPKLPRKYIPEVKSALQRINVKWEDFRVTDNSCGPRPAPETATGSVLRTLEAGKDRASDAAQKTNAAVEDGFEYLGRGIMRLANEGQLPPSNERTKRLQAAAKEEEEAKRYLAEIQRQWGSIKHD